jgi:hypothetical protein
VTTNGAGDEYPFPDRTTTGAVRGCCPPVNVTGAVTWVGDTTVVVLSFPSKLTTDPAANPDPSTVNVNWTASRPCVVGLIDVNQTAGTPRAFDSPAT